MLENNAESIGGQSEAEEDVAGKGEWEGVERERGKKRGWGSWRRRERDHRTSKFLSISSMDRAKSTVHNIKAKALFLQGKRGKLHPLLAPRVYGKKRGALEGHM